MKKPKEQGNEQKKKEEILRVDGSQDWMMPRYGGQSPEYYIKRLEELEKWDDPAEALQEALQIQHNIETDMQEKETTIEKLLREYVAREGKDYEQYMEEIVYFLSYESMKEDFLLLKEICESLYGENPLSEKQSLYKEYDSDEYRLIWYIELIRKKGKIPEKYQEQWEKFDKKREACIREVLENKRLTLFYYAAGQLRKLSDTERNRLSNLHHKHHALEIIYPHASRIIYNIEEQARILSRSLLTCSPINWTGTEATCKKVLSYLMDNKYIERAPLNIFLSKHFTVKGKQLNPEQWRKVDGNVGKAQKLQDNLHDFLNK